VTRADRLVRHELAGLEHLEMLGNRGPADRKPRGKLADRDRAAAQYLHDLAARPVAKGVKDAFVSLHEP
jgi:hypothetical protein